jgi:spermidine synthase
MAETSFTSWFEEAFGDEGTKFGLAIKKKCHEEQTPYQKLEIYETETFGHLMVLDGCVMLTSRDNFLYHEMITHPALFTHPAPKRVVVVGGGDCGTLREVLKHNTVTHACQVEIDERVTKASEIYFPELCESNSDPRAEFYFEDAVAWIQRQDNASIDVLIIDSTDPIGPAEQLFGPAFLKEAFRTLGPNGIIVQQSESPILHSKTIIADLETKLLGAGFSHPQQVMFPQPCYPSGWWSATMAQKSAAALTPRYSAIESKDWPTSYYNRAIHDAALARPEFMKRT